MVSWFRRNCLGSWAEVRYTAYVEMSWYFGMFAIVSLVFAIWGSSTINHDATAGISNKDDQSTCDAINSYLNTYSISSFIELTLCMFLTVGIIAISSSPRWAFFSLFHLGLFGIFFFAKFIILVMGALQLFNTDAMNVCSSSVPKLYDNAKSFFIATVVVYLVQLTAGTAFLLGCGLEDAVEEGLQQFEKEEFVSSREKGV